MAAAASVFVELDPLEEDGTPALPFAFPAQVPETVDSLSVNLCFQNLKNSGSLIQ